VIHFSAAISSLSLAFQLLVACCNRRVVPRFPGNRSRIASERGGDASLSSFALRIRAFTDRSRINSPWKVGTEARALRL